MNFSKNNLMKSENGIVNILIVISRQIYVIVLVPFIFCLITIINLVFFSSPVFESSVKITSAKKSVNNNPGMGLARQFGILLDDGSEEKWLITEVVKSKTLAKSMLKRKFYSEKYNEEKTLLYILNGKQRSGKEFEGGAINKFHSMLYFKRNGSFFDLKIESFEARLAKDILEIFVEELVLYQKNLMTEKALKTKNFITNRLIETEIELNNAEEDLKIFRERNRRIENSPSLQMQEQRIIREVAVLTGVFTTLKQQFETAKIEEVKESDYVMIIDPPEVPIYRSKPRKTYLTIMSGILGIGVGFLVAFIKDNIELSNTLNNELRQVWNLLISNLQKLFRFNL